MESDFNADMWLFEMCSDDFDIEPPFFSIALNNDKYEPI